MRGREAANFFYAGAGEETRRRRDGRVSALRLGAALQQITLEC